MQNLQYGVVHQPSRAVETTLGWLTPYLWKDFRPSTTRSLGRNGHRKDLEYSDTEMIVLREAGIIAEPIVWSSLSGCRLVWGAIDTMLLAWALRSFFLWRGVTARASCVQLQILPRTQIASLWSTEATSFRGGVAFGSQTTPFVPRKRNDNSIWR